MAAHWFRAKATQTQTYWTGPIQIDIRQTDAFLRLSTIPRPGRPWWILFISQRGHRWLFGGRPCDVNLTFKNQLRLISSATWSRDPLTLTSSFNELLLCFSKAEKTGQGWDVSANLTPSGRINSAIVWQSGRVKKRQFLLPLFLPKRDGPAARED